jgi:hypothetical protein
MTQSPTTANLPGTTVVNTTQASTTAVTTTRQQIVIATSSSPASTGTPATFGYFAKSISDSITNFANKFAIIGVAALVLGLGCAFVVYRRVNSEGEVEE